MMESSLIPTEGRKIKSKVFREAIIFSKFHYSEKLAVHESLDAIEIFEKTTFDEDYILKNLEMIQQVVEQENMELELAIEDLRKIINGEEPTFDSPVKQKTKQSTSRNTNKDRSKIDPFNLQTGQDSLDFPVKVKEKPMKSSSSTTTILGIKHTEQINSLQFFEDSFEDKPNQKTSHPNNNNIASPTQETIVGEEDIRPNSTETVFSPRINQSSKFRNKLKQAQQELYLSDEF
jgi:hypothetical protein